MNPPKKISQIENLTDLAYFEAKLDTDEYFWSDELYKIYEIEPGEHPASFELFLSFVLPEERHKVVSNLQDSISKQKPTTLYDYRVTCAGKKKHLQVEMELSYNDKGQCIRRFGIVRVL